MGSRAPSLHAVIGVDCREGRTYYVRRSESMENFPGVWSLPSYRFAPSELKSPKDDLGTVQKLFARLSDERLGGTSIRVNEHLISGDDPDSPVGQHVFLHLYGITLFDDPNLNAAYYTDGAWLTPAEYQHRSAGQPCGLCLRLWSDYAWLAGMSDRPFVPQAVASHG